MKALVVQSPVVAENRDITICIWKCRNESKEMLRVSFFSLSADLNDDAFNERMEEMSSRKKQLAMTRRTVASRLQQRYAGDESMKVMTSNGPDVGEGWSLGSEMVVVERGSER